MRKQPESGTKSRNLKDNLHVDLLSFESLKATPLYLDFLRKERSLAPFFTESSFSSDPVSLARQISAVFPIERRAELARILTRQNQDWGAPPETIQAIVSLLEQDTVVVATGHQLALFGGPLFTLYKALSIIVLSKRLNKDSNIQTVPVFWLADEDHDLPEVLEYGVSQTKDVPFDPLLGTFKLHDEGFPVGRVTLPDSIMHLLDELSIKLDSSFGSEMMEILRRYYKPGNTFQQAFASLMLKWFGKFGLVLISADQLDFKQWAAPLYIKTIQDSESLFQSLSMHTQQLIKAGYHQQVQFEESHLFRYAQNGKRVKVKRSKEGWTTLDSAMTTSELLEDIHKSPDCYSPGVLLRLVLQSSLLPVVMVVGGPAEIAYAAQSMPLFEHTGIPMPSFQGRYSATVLEPNVKRNFDRLEFALPQYQRRMEDIESLWIEHHTGDTARTNFDLWTSELATLHTRYASLLTSMDLTLEASFEKALVSMKHELDRLERKVRKAQKRRHDIDLLRIQMVKQAIYPSNHLQERVISAFSLYAQHGPEMWDALLQIFEENEANHHLILSFNR